MDTSSASIEAVHEDDGVLHPEVDAHNGARRSRRAAPNADHLNHLPQPWPERAGARATTAPPSLEQMEAAQAAIAAIYSDSPTDRLRVLLREMFGKWERIFAEDRRKFSALDMAKRGVGGTFETPHRLSNKTTANVITRTYGH